ncbi:Bifunctional solanapyrone synthase [Rhizoctonia solani]|uniref:Bifunctional solanapyrone synthase n=1 Tax=Rhizoctonia solani TaxID=456999 RepID=A0A0K6FP86_9AGAM|nr:Bifunctional solanapyrone synthase [Rhizoctonia solani]
MVRGVAQWISVVGLLAVGCDRLTASLSQGKVFKKLNPSYTLENQKYWSSTCVLNPSCIVVPQSSSDVSTAVKILTTNNCQFAIRGGGHTANPGWAGTNSGVLISLSKLTAIKLSEDKASVVIGAGNRWGEVYAKIGEHGVTVTGGRLSSVGVSGFILGGGLSFLMHKEGFAANNVLSYEIVLANGTVATVTKASAGDLFKALKGGTGNFGIATSFTLQTYPINNVYAGNLYYSPDKYDALFPIMEAYARQGTESDPKTHVISAFVYVPSQAIEMAAFYSFYSEPVTTPPPAIKPFFDVPTLVNTVKVKTVKEAADELGTGTTNGSRQDMRTFSIRANAGLYKQLVERWNSMAITLNPISGWFSAIAFQPVSNSMIRASDEKGGNVLGLQPAADPLIADRVPVVLGTQVVNYQFTWALPTDDKEVYAMVDKLIADSTNIARAQDRLAEYMYLNYAGFDQLPLQSYGPTQLDFLREVKSKYDPNDVFEKLSRGGFKIPS